MRRKIIVPTMLATVGAFWMVGIALAAPDNKNSITIGMECDHGIGAITGAGIDQNSAGTLNIVRPGHGSYAIKRAVIGGQLVYENPGFASRFDDLVRCVPVSFNGGPLPPDNPSVVWWGILTVQ
jgi:hypothetical protein